jgi:hypothetical protein
MERRGFLKSIFGAGAAIAIAPVVALAGSPVSAPMVTEEFNFPVVYGGKGHLVRIEGGELGRGWAPRGYLMGIPMPKGY